MTALPDLLDVPVRGKHHKHGRQRALIRAATAVFAERGYDCATTREVAERSGCSEGLIHRYFGGKRGLLLAVLESRRAEAIAEFEKGAPPGDDLRDEIERIMLWSMDNIWQRRDFMRVSVSQAAIDPEIGRMVGDRLNRERVEILSRRLERHRAAGRLSDDVDIHAVAQALSAQAFVYGFFGQVVFEMAPHYARRVALAAADAICNGIASSPTARLARRQRRKESSP